MRSWLRRIRNYRVPPTLQGFTLGHWLRLLNQNGIPVERPIFLSMVTLAAARTSLQRQREESRYGSEFRAARVEPPVFIIGYWRSGTTHLHNLLSIDDRFAYPNHHQVHHPFTFLTTEEDERKASTGREQATRLQDNVRAGPFSPAEDEFALTALTPCAFYLGLLFPKRADHYTRFLSFRVATDRETSSWKHALDWFLRKLSWKYRRPLVLKSPGHTARIRLLLELYPDARFVHIRRDPFAVFRSVEHTARKTAEPTVVARHAETNLESRILGSYREVYDTFFEQHELIPPGRYCEVAFEDLERDPLGQMQAVYRTLDLPSFGLVEPAMARYAASLAGYKKNTYAPLPAPLTERIARQWQRCFTEWGYPV